jgi:uncharacterized OsmC-like protein
LGDGLIQDNSIEAFGLPLAFRTKRTGFDVPATAGNLVSIRAVTRALQGMQKEALVSSPRSPDGWRFVCDEGPYLNGTDLAPPPLAYFSAGMASCYIDALQNAALQAGTSLSGAHIVQDNHYTMEGSAIRGTMIAGALPVELSLQATFGNSSVDTLQVARQALEQSPLEALMHDALLDTFSIVHNGTQISTGTVPATANPVPHNPAAYFADLVYDESPQSQNNSVCKLESAQAVFEADHGTGAAMKDQQKRRLHLRTVLTLQSDGFREIRVQICKPIGSVFQFISTSPDNGNAPSGLTLASAGIAFCFMTQIGRYAGIVKKDLADYGVVQDSIFDVAHGRTLPIDTHAFVDSSEDAATVRRYVDMAEQTCFLHGACRMSNATQLVLA